MLVAMSPDDIGWCLAGALAHRPLDVSPGQEDHGDELGDSLVGLEAEVAEAETKLQVPVVGFTAPALGVAL